MFFSKSKNLVGLDIGSSAVKLVELKEKKGGQFQLVKIGLEPLSPEAIVDGSIMDSSMVVDTITRIVDEQGVKNQNFGTSVSGHSVIIKKITLPAMSPEELAESIQWEAEQYIPFDINDVNLDYVPLNQGADNVDIILVAVKKEKIADYTSVISQAGKSAGLVDVDGFALQNAYELNYEVVPGETVVLVNAGASIVNINIVKGNVTAFTRDISMGGNQFTEEIQKQLNVSYDEAEALKVGGDIMGDNQSVVPQEVENIIVSVSENVATEIQRSLDFY
ncbi:MAG: type IV pilus assembly protein PilM, partial [Thermoanaerobaculia bacterium]|nr:type IV pilus assembly protein PilM [Thermoanaerobaculia bacterium]